MVSHKSTWLYLNLAINCFSSSQSRGEHETCISANTTTKCIPLISCGAATPFWFCKYHMIMFTYMPGLYLILRETYYESMCTIICKVNNICNHGICVCIYTNRYTFLKPAFPTKYVPFKSHKDWPWGNLQRDRGPISLAPNEVIVRSQTQYRSLQNAPTWTEILIIMQIPS